MLAGGWVQGVTTDTSVDTAVLDAKRLARFQEELEAARRWHHLTPEEKERDTLIGFGVCLLFTLGLFSPMFAWLALRGAG